MKILFVSSGNKENQPGIVVQNQANSLTNAGVEISYYLIIGKGLRGYIKNIHSLYRYLKSNKCDLVHSHYSLSAFVTTIALWFLPSKMHIVSLMGSDTKMNIIYKLFVKLCSKFFWNKTIVKSHKMLEDLGLNKAEIIPNGVDLNKIDYNKRQLSNLPRQMEPRTDYVVLFPANPSRVSKNYSLAKESMNGVTAELKVVYNLPHEELIDELFKANVVLSTSLWEGSPNVIKEAMACNRPIVATDVGDIRWLFDNRPGHFITSFEPSDVAAKIKKALLFAANKQNTSGRDQILSLGLDSETVAKRILQVYQNALKK